MCSAGRCHACDPTSFLARLRSRWLPRVPCPAARARAAARQLGGVVDVRRRRLARGGPVGLHHHAAPVAERAGGHKHVRARPLEVVQHLRQGQGEVGGWPASLAGAKRCDPGGCNPRRRPCTAAPPAGNAAPPVRCVSAAQAQRGQPPPAGGQRALRASAGGPSAVTQADPRLCARDVPCRARGGAPCSARPRRPPAAPLGAGDSSAWRCARCPGSGRCARRGGCAR